MTSKKSSGQDKLPRGAKQAPKVRIQSQMRSSCKSYPCLVAMHLAQESFGRIDDSLDGYRDRLIRYTHVAGLALPVKRPYECSRRITRAHLEHKGR